MIIRDERPADLPDIRHLLLDVMGAQEAQLVDDLRADGDAILSLVAEEDGHIAGHILFSSLEAPFRALALAPVCVVADRQGAGIGSALVSAGIERARGKGWEAVFVMGDPAYYVRFGFDVTAAAGFGCVYAGPYLMALPLGGALPARSGAIVYPPAFARLQ